MCNHDTCFSISEASLAKPCNLSPDSNTSLLSPASSTEPPAGTFKDLAT